MNKNDILKALEPLIGREFANYAIKTYVFNQLGPMLKEHKLTYETSPVTGDYLYYDQRSSVIYLKSTLNDATVLTIKPKRKRGTYDAYDTLWAITGFEVELFGGETVEEILDNLRKFVADKKNAENLRKAEVAEVVKLVMKATGKSYEDVLDGAKDFCKFYYYEAFKKMCLQDN